MHFGQIHDNFGNDELRSKKQAYRSIRISILTANSGQIYKTRTNTIMLHRYRYSKKKPLLTSKVCAISIKRKTVVAMTTYPVNTDKPNNKPTTVNTIETAPYIQDSNTKFETNSACIAQQPTAIAISMPNMRNILYETIFNAEINFRIGVCVWIFC